MIEVRGRSAVMRYEDRRLTVTADHVIVDAAVNELLKIRLAWIDEHSLIAEFLFRSPDFVIDGVPTARNPYVVDFPAENLEGALEFTKAIRVDLIAIRKVTIEAPDLTPPAPIAGAQRPDVLWAASRVRQAREIGPAVTAMHIYARPDEYVLEMAACVHDGQPGVAVLTTTRVLFIVAQQVGGITFEFPFAGINGHRLKTAPPVADLELFNGFSDMAIALRDGNHEDLSRFADAVKFAANLDRNQGTTAPVSPTPVELFAEWQLLLERRSLGMVDEDEFQQRGRGIMLAMPG